MSTRTTSITDSYNKSDYRIATDSYNQFKVGNNSVLDLSRRFDYSTATNAGSNSFTPPIPTAPESTAIGDTISKAAAAFNPTWILYGVAAIAALLLLKMFLKKGG